MPNKATAPDTCIPDLNLCVCALTSEQQRLFHRLYQVDIAQGRLVVPPAMRDWVTKQFGSVEAVERQHIVKVLDRVTLEGALFNEVRAARPVEIKDPRSIEDWIAQARRHDTFHDPYANTPEDTFGRVQRSHCVTASNIAKYDQFHGLVIFNEHHPLRFTRTALVDYLDAGLAWARRAHKTDPAARYFFLMWNCLWRSGATIVHGHMQMTLGRKSHYARVERLRRSAARYARRHSSSYFDDLFRVHQALGLAFPLNGARIIVSLTPVKDKEVIVLNGRNGASLDAGVKSALYDILAAYRDTLGVRSFNLAAYLPPIAPTRERWKGFPAHLRVVDRGDPGTRASDIGAMELYAQPVISSDPFRVARSLKEALGVPPSR